MKVYLSGGFHSNWQEKTKGACPQINFFDPKMILPKNWNVDRYSTWDLFYIKQSDIIFAYMERSNPGGFGLAMEIGYAKGLGKTVILVLEERHEIHKDIYLEFLKAGADIFFKDLDEGINYLSSFQ